MLRLAIAALACARALALPAAPGKAIAPYDFERTHGPKCCGCKKKDSSYVLRTNSVYEDGCWTQAGCKDPNGDEETCKKESCHDACAGYGGYERMQPQETVLDDRPGSTGAQGFNGLNGVTQFHTVSGRKFHGTCSDKDAMQEWWEKNYAWDWLRLGIPHAGERPTVPLTGGMQANFGVSHGRERHQENTRGKARAARECGTGEFLQPH